MMKALSLLLACLALFQATPAVAFSINGYLTRAALENAASDPSTTLTGRVYWNTTTNAAKVYNGTAWTSLGSGAGSGEKNYLSTGTDSATGWAASGAGITCTTTTANVPDASVGTALAVTGQVGNAGTEYCFYNYDDDEADGSKVLKLAFDQKPVSYTASHFRVDVYTCTVAWSGTPATTCSGTLTRLALSTDNSSGVTALPNQTGTIAPPPTYSTLAWATAKHLQVRIGLNGSSTDQMNFAQVLTGPGTVVQSAAVGPWTQFFDATSYTSYVNNFTAAGGTAGFYRRDGDGIDMDVRLRQSGTTGASPIQLLLPNSLTPNTALLPSVITQAKCAYTVASTSAQTPCSVTWDGTGFEIYTSGGTAGRTMANGATTDQYYVHIDALPMSQYAGQGTVYLGQGGQQFACSTTGTWDAAAAATNTIIGPDGCPISGALTASRNKIVQFSFPISVQTPPILEYRNASTGIWVHQADSEWPNTGAASVAFGGFIYFAGTTTSSITVVFNQYAVAGTTYNTTTGATNYSGAVYDRWRVELPYPGGAQGFANVTQSNAGLVASAGQLLGTNTNDDACATCVGAYLEASNTTWTSIPASGQYFDGASKAVTAGDWDAYGVCAFYVATATWTASPDFACGLSAVSGNTSTGLTPPLNYADEQFATTAAQTYYCRTPTVRFKSDGTTLSYAGRSDSGQTIYLKCNGSPFTGTANYRSFLRMRRVR